MMPSGQRVYVGGASLIAKNKVSDAEEDDVTDIGEIVMRNMVIIILD